MWPDIANTVGPCPTLGMLAGGENTLDWMEDAYDALTVMPSVLGVSRLAYVM